MYSILQCRDDGLGTVCEKQGNASESRRKCHQVVPIASQLKVHLSISSTNSTFPRAAKEVYVDFPQAYRKNRANRRVDTCQPRYITAASCSEGKVIGKIWATPCSNFNLGLAGGKASHCLQESQTIVSATFLLNIHWRTSRFQSTPLYVLRR